MSVRAVCWSSVDLRRSRVAPPQRPMLRWQSGSGYCPKTLTGTEFPLEAMVAAGEPQDIPDERPVSLDRLEALVGEWEMEATFQAGFFGAGSPETTSRGRAKFQWLEGRFFLTQSFVNEHPDTPSGITIIGMTEERNTFAQHYYDSRGVARVYQMTLEGREWKLWREAPGFWQRYTGVISEDGTTITGAWEASGDGQQWKHDFDLTYLRTG